MSLYPAFTKDVAVVKQLLESLPPALKDALGISLETFFSIYGFYIYILTYVFLGGAIFAMNLGVATTSKEERDKTADFLLTKPVNRSNILSAKILANISSILIVDICFFIAALLMARSVAGASFSPKTFLLISLILLFIQLIFLALGTLLSTVLPKIKSAIAVSLLTVFAFFIISMLGSVLGDEAVRYITPFKFFDPLYVVSHNGYETTYLTLEVIIITLSISSSYLFYNRRDIEAAS